MITLPNPIGLLLTLALIGFLLWLAERFIPMDVTIKLVIRGVVFFFVIVWLLQTFGVLRW